MTDIDKMRFLTRSLLDEDWAPKGIQVPSDGPGLWKLLRAMMNLRPPLPCNEEVLAVQDSLLKGIVENTHPKLLIVIDALASRSIERISSTVQISDTGIVPGAGVGNTRKEISQNTLGIPVVAIGIPTVVETAVLVNDSLDLFITKLQDEAKSNDYLNQLKDNFLRQGKGNIGQGSISPSWITAFNQIGIVPEEVYTGINYNDTIHNHTELVAYMTAIAKESVNLKTCSEQYEQLINSLFDIYMGKVPEKFNYKGKEYTPKSFAQSLSINTNDYIMLTSFTHKPYYQPFEIEIPDNWEHAKMYNLPLDEMMSVMNEALKQGYTICWDGDVSERGFSYINGVAINPEVNDTKNYKDSDQARWNQITPSQRLSEVYQFKRPYPEIDVTPEIRQQGYESYTTTDDHLMHITGLTKDQNGTKYYITKNSWGTERNRFGGYINMSESFVRAKTVYVMMHKDALSKELKKKLGIK